MKGRQNGRTNLHHEPTDDAVGNGNLVDVAPLKFGKERLHGGPCLLHDAARGEEETALPLRLSLSWQDVSVRITISP
jgi:hypothetical protein